MRERKMERERAGERERNRKRDRGERERETQVRKRRSDRGEREKIPNTKKFVEFYLVVLHSAERSEARQWIVAQQVSCYNPLSCFNPVTRSDWLVLVQNIVGSQPIRTRKNYAPASNHQKKLPLILQLHCVPLMPQIYQKFFSAIRDGEHGFLSHAHFYRGKIDRFCIKWC